MDQVREVLRYHHYGRKTELAYVRWIKGYIYCSNALVQNYALSVQAHAKHGVFMAFNYRTWFDNIRV